MKGRDQIVEEFATPPFRNGTIKSKASEIIKRTLSLALVIDGLVPPCETKEQALSKMLEVKMLCLHALAHAKENFD